MMSSQLDLLDCLATQNTAAPSTFDPVVLYRIDPAHNMHRYYAPRIERTLFGDWAVVRQWGRIGSSGGQQRSALCTNQDEACAALQWQRQEKERRGYANA